MGRRSIGLDPLALAQQRKKAAARRKIIQAGGVVPEKKVSERKPRKPRAPKAKKAAHPELVEEARVIIEADASSPLASPVKEKEKEKEKEETKTVAAAAVVAAPPKLSLKERMVLAKKAKQEADAAKKAAKEKKQAVEPAAAAAAAKPEKEVEEVDSPEYKDFAAQIADDLNDAPGVQVDKNSVRKTIIVSWTGATETCYVSIGLVPHVARSAEDKYKDDDAVLLTAVKVKNDKAPEAKLAVTQFAALYSTDGHVGHLGPTLQGGSAPLRPDLQPVPCGRLATPHLVVNLDMDIVNGAMSRPELPAFAPFTKLMAMAYHHAVGEIAA